MPIPILCLDEEVRYFAERFREGFSKPQYQHFVTVLLGLMLCEGARTLSGLVQQVADSPSLAGLSRFLSEAPWQEAAVGESWLRHFREEMQPKRRGRPKAPVVTGYLIGDDSTMRQQQGQEDGGTGDASFDDRGQTGGRLIAWSRVCMWSWDDAVPWLPAVSRASGLRSGRRAFCPQD